METNKWKKTLSAYSPEFQEEDWMEMQILLEKEEKKKRILLFPLLALILIIAIRGLVFNTTDFSKAQSAIHSSHLSSIAEMNFSHIPQFLNIISTDNESVSSKWETSVPSFLSTKISSNNAIENLHITTTIPDSKSTKYNLNGENETPSNDWHATSYSEIPTIPTVNMSSIPIQLPTLGNFDSSQTPQESTSGVNSYHIYTGIAQFYHSNLKFDNGRSGLSLGLHWRKNRWNGNAGITMILNSSVPGVVSGSSETRYSINNEIINSGGDMSLNPGEDSKPSKLPFSDKTNLLIQNSWAYELISRKMSLALGAQINYITGNGRLLIGPRLDLGYQLGSRCTLQLNSSIYDELWMTELGISYRFHPSKL